MTEQSSLFYSASPARLLPAALLLLVAAAPFLPRPTSAHELPAPTPEQMQQWINQLGDDSFHVREAAHAALVAAGNPAYFALEALPQSDDAEVRDRVQRILAALEADAVEQLQRLGGGFRKPNGTKHWNEFSIASVRLRDDDLAPLARLNKLETVYIRNSPITDRALVHLRSLRRVKSLSLWGTQMTDDGLEMIQSLESVELISLSDANISNEGLKHLAKMPHLSRIVLANTSIDGKGLLHLKPLEKQVELLHLRDTGVTDEDLRHLSGFSALKGLDLGNTSITGPGLAYLKNLPNLMGLNLTGSDVQGEWLVHLAELPALKHLCLLRTGVQPDSLLVLRDTPQLVSIIVPAETFTEEEAKVVERALNAKHKGEKLFIHRGRSN